MLTPGTTLGPYEITGAIGAGGMGEVYRARDTKLGRDVALKVLPEAFASDAERMARFEREAKVLASLNHPNIAAIYGFEESSGAGSPARAPLRALVMELVEGPTLADRIAQGPIPIDEALPIAKQICDALEYAHERGIVHRDLKPANVKITPDGMVKLLDFGLAKALEGDSLSGDMSNSPTISRMATQAGIILGTAAYMAPEQAKGRPVDRRADIWAFGCVLYEMLTGKKPFEGETISDVLAAVIMKNPDWAAVPPETPRRVRELLERCLTKDLRERLQSIGEARISIQKSMSGETDVAPDATAMPVVPAVPFWRRVLPWASTGLFALVAVALAVALFVILRAPAAPAPSVANLEFDMGEVSLADGYGSRVLISPNGREIVFVGASGSQTQLYMRSMDSENITPLPGTQGANEPFFSPNGQWVGFSINDKLEKEPLTGGLPVTLCDLPGDFSYAPAVWADNGFIYFLTLPGKVDRVPAGGGSPQPVAAAADPDKLSYRSISSLPGSRGLLLTATNGASEYDIDVLSLETGKSKRLIDGGSWPSYLPAGQIVYAQFSSGGASPGFTGGLLAVPFDLKSLTVTGSPIPVMEGVAAGIYGGGLYDVAANGTLVYAPGSGTEGTKRLAWLDPKGKIQPLPAPPGNYANLTFSPDGKRVAMTKTIGTSEDIYIYDLNRNTMQRLTFNGRSTWPVFTPDAKRVIYVSTGANGGAYNLWMRPADGSGKAERLTTSKFGQFQPSISPDGKLLAYTQQNPKTSDDIYVMPLQGDRKPQALIHTPSTEVLPAFSPDGKWIAYVSTETGNPEVFVQAFPAQGGKFQISTGAGPHIFPTWSRDGKKLYYRSGGNLMEVDVATRPAFSAGTPRVVASNLGNAGPAGRSYDVAPDGRILLSLRTGQTEQGSLPMHVVLNFATEVQNRLAAAKQ